MFVNICSKIGVRMRAEVLSVRKEARRDAGPLSDDTGQKIFCKKL